MLVLPKGYPKLPISGSGKEKYHISYNIADTSPFDVHLGKGAIRLFQQSDISPFYSDMRSKSWEPKEHVFIKTLAKNKSKYENYNYLDAIDAKKL